MSTSNFWLERLDNSTGNYSCPWCDRELKSKVSNSAKNPGKSFVSCSRDYGGCGLFSFLSEQPNEKFRPKAGKRARVEGGTNIIGPIANRPNVTDERLAELASKLDELTTQVAATHHEITETRREVMDYLKS